MIKIEIVNCKGTSEIYFNDEIYYPRREGGRETFVLPIEDFDSHTFSIVYYVIGRNNGWDFITNTKDNYLKAFRYGYNHCAIKVDMIIRGKADGVIKLSFDDKIIKYGLFSLTYPEIAIRKDSKNIIQQCSIAHFPSNTIQNLTIFFWIARAIIIWIVVELLCVIWIFSIVSPEPGTLVWEQYKIQLLIGVPVIAIGITIVVFQDIVLINRFITSIHTN